jgi:hypothetical protein
MQLAPGAHRVPGWLRAIVARGLATDPAARWPSIDAIVQALGRRRRGAVWLGAGALATAIHEPTVAAAKAGDDLADPRGGSRRGATRGCVPGTLVAPHVCTYGAVRRNSSWYLCP